MDGIAAGGSGLLVTAASKSFCESRRGYDSGGRTGGVGGRGWRAVCGAAATNTEVGRAGLGAVCSDDEYGDRAARVGGGLRGFRGAGPWFSGAGVVYIPLLIVSTDTDL